MATIVSVHSFRGGTGKSNTTANLAAIYAERGLRVGVLDTDIQSPGIHVLFGVDASNLDKSLNDYLWGLAEIEEAAIDVTGSLGRDVSGKVFLIPSRLDPTEIARILQEGFDVGLLNDGIHRLIERLNLDVVLVDTHPGVNEETLLSIAISDGLAIVMRPDQQDYQGTAVTVDVARHLGVPNLQIIVNKAPESFPPDELRRRVEDAYASEVAGILPHSDDLMTLASSGVFSMRYPDHPLSDTYRQIASKFVPME